MTFMNGKIPALANEDDNTVEDSIIRSKSDVTHDIRSVDTPGNRDDLMLDMVVAAEEGDAGSESTVGRALSSTSLYRVDRQSL